MPRAEEKATRVSKSLTHDWERRVLPRMARALPRWVSPDLMTGLGVFAAFVVAASYVLSWLSPWWMALSVVGLALHWLGDSLDGTLARVRRQERERYGYFVDRIADAVSLLVIGVGFGLSPYVSLVSGLALVVAYMLLMVFSEICAYTSRRFPLSFARLGPTEGRIALALFNVALIFWQPGPALAAAGVTLTSLDLVVLAIALLFVVFFLVSAVAEARRLDRADRGLLAERVVEEQKSAVLPSGQLPAVR